MLTASHTPHYVGTKGPACPSASCDALDAAYRCVRKVGCFRFYVPRCTKGFKRKRILTAHPAERGIPQTHCAPLPTSVLLDMHQRQTPVLPSPKTNDIAPRSIPFPFPPPQNIVQRVWQVSPPHLARAWRGACARPRDETISSGVK